MNGRILGGNNKFRHGWSENGFERERLILLKGAVELLKVKQFQVINSVHGAGDSPEIILAHSDFREDNFA